MGAWGGASRTGGKPHPLLGGDAILTPSLAATAVQASRYRNESRTHHINAKVERRRTCFPKSMTSTSLYHVPSNAGVMPDMRVAVRELLDR